MSSELANGLSAELLSRYEREGYVICEQVLNDADLAPARDAMNEKVDKIAAGLLADGLISDPLVNEPFETRLVPRQATFARFEMARSSSLSA